MQPSTNAARIGESSTANANAAAKSIHDGGEKSRDSATGNHSASVKKKGVMDVLQEIEQSAGLKERKPDPHTLRGIANVKYVRRRWRRIENLSIRWDYMTLHTYSDHPYSN